MFLFLSSAHVHIYCFLEGISNFIFCQLDLNSFGLNFIFVDFQFLSHFDRKIKADDYFRLPIVMRNVIICKVKKL